MPREVFSRHIVERAPNHDNTKPCFTAWQFFHYPPNYSAQPSDQDRPKWAIQVYDTTVTAGNEAQVRELARRLYKETKGARYCQGDDAADRIDVYGLPLDVETPDEGRFVKCIEHQIAERRARNATGSSDFYIPVAHPECDYFKHRILVVTAAATKDQKQDIEDAGKEHGSTLEDDHSDKEGGNRRLDFAVVEFDSRAGVTRPDHFWIKDDWSELGEYLMGFRESIEWFYDCYVPDGMMDEELRIAAASSANDT